MAKRNRKLDYDKMIKEGIGSGKGKDYKPWLEIQDFPSKGRVTRVKGIKTQRQHELFSDLERNYFYYLDFSDNVVDIREQFPLLPIEETMIIAKELGIEHPNNPVTKEPIVMTTDFLITLKEKNGEIIENARTVKYKKDLVDKRVLEKFEIERQYYSKRGIDWGIVTEEEVDKSVSKSIADLYTYRNLEEVESFKEISIEELDDIKLYFIRQCASYEGTLKSLCSCFDRTMSMYSGSGISMFKHLLITKMVSINIFEGIDLKKHIDITINEVNNNVRGVS